MWQNQTSVMRRPRKRGAVLRRRLESVGGGEWEGGMRMEAEKNEGVWLMGGVGTGNEDEVVRRVGT